MKREILIDFFFSSVYHEGTNILTCALEQNMSVFLYDA